MISVYITVKSKKLRDDFCSSLDKANSVKVTDTFDTLKECREKLAVSLPHILLLGLDLPDGYWIDFCKEIHEKYPALKILAITSYDEYFIFKNSLNTLTSGYISKDALPKVVVSAIHTVMEGEFFRYDKSAPQAEKEGNEPEWLQNVIPQIIEKIKSNDNHRETIERLSNIIHAIEKERSMMIENMLTNQKDSLDFDCTDKYLKLLIENMLIMGHSNWAIAEALNISIETVRLYRMEFIMKLSGHNSMIIAINKQGKTIKLNRRERQTLSLIAAGFTNQEIADNILYVDVETVNTVRKNLIQKFEAKNAMSMVVSAIRMGLLKIEDIDSLLA